MANYVITEIDKTCYGFATIGMPHVVITTKYLIASGCLHKTLTM